MSRREIRIAGFGGQGVVLSGTITAKAASIYDGKFATLTQSYGPESRGGSCRAEAVVDDEPIDYPYVVKPEVQIILSQEAYSEYALNSKSKALIIIDEDLVTPDPGNKDMTLSIPASRIAQELGRPVVANIIVLGFLSANSDIASPNAFKKAILASVPAGTEELNMKAFDLGYSYVTSDKSKE